ncbi:hypothetical protein SUGI_0776230 [Cryptomeria japonica]|uniref:uncharacterized protein LOC131030056 n=1 Tax=Cryptomeria japonica TaxID=3369 RepID=UPI0024147B17|nr:uncharacterized protein LOC131030056 [Cryptomeria japonica]GLJ38128.1 hypothetical protein SUGI_0776230 [Cryptomeria japonica]
MPLEISPFVLSLVVVPLIVCMLFTKWKSTASRTAKIRKLLELAEEEAGKAEAEAAAVDYGNSSTMLDRLNQCAICFGPTTSRCSRCKTVRYCSGKCQIVHWRKGHKQECQPSDSRTKSDIPILFKTEEVKTLDVNIQEARNFVSGSQRLGSLSAEVSEISASGEIDLQITNPKATEKVSDVEVSNATESREPAVFTVEPEVNNSDIHLSSNISTHVPATASPINGMHGCQITLSDPCSTCTEALPHYANSDTGSSCDGIGLSSENIVNQATFLADAVNRVPCSSEKMFNACNSKMCDDPVPPSFVKNLTGCPVSEHKLNRSLSFTHDLSSPGRFIYITEITPDSTHESSKSKNNICDHPPDHSSITDNHIVDTASSENHISDTDSEISRLDIPFFGNFDVNIFSSAISNLNVPYLQSSTSTCSERSLMIGDTGSSSLFNIIKFQNQEPNESNTTISEDEIQGPSTTMSNGAMEMSPQIVICSSQNKERASGCTFSNEDDSNIDDDSISMHNLDPTANGLNRTEKKSAWHSRSPKPVTPNTAKRTNEFLGEPAKLLFPYEYFTKLFKWENLELAPRGLINCGNSCFANVVLQCLTYTRPVAAYLLHGSHSQKCQKKDWCFMCELEFLVSRVRGGDGALSPIRILSRIKNIGNHLGYGKQEDAHEFLRFAVDTMQSICLDEAGGDEAIHPITHVTTFIQQTFGGYLQSKVECKMCNYESNRYEIMMDLTVEVNGNIESLEDALKQFAAAEFLDGENKYKCDRCKSYVKAQKWLTVHEAPNILTIALKRFQTGSFGKLNKIVAFPEVLDMSPYMSGKGDKPPLYNLYAVVVHLDMLNASFFGHYICYVKDLKGAWYKIDDSKVNPVSIDAVMAEGAYMLFYSRSSPRPPAIILDGKIPGFKNNCACHAMQTSSCNKHNVEADVPISQFPFSGFSGAASIDIGHPVKVQDRENCSMDLDSIIPDKVDTFGFKGEKLHPIMQDRDNDLISRESGDLTSSDAGSLFSGSDETSCSSDSNRDSISTVDLAETVPGDPRYLAYGGLNIDEACETSSSSSCMELLSRPSETQTFVENKPSKCPPEVGAIYGNNSIFADKSSINQGLRNRRTVQGLSFLSNSHIADTDKLSPWTSVSSFKLFCQPSSNSVVSEESQPNDMLDFRESIIKREECLPQSPHCSGVNKNLNCSKDNLCQNFVLSAKWKHGTEKWKAEEIKRLKLQSPSRTCNTSNRFEQYLANDPKTSSLSVFQSLGFER